MPRPPLPTAIHEAKGTYIQHLERRREAEPEPKGPLMEPETQLDEAEMMVWNRLLEVLPDGVTTIENGYPLTILSKLMMRALSGDAKAWEHAQIRSWCAGFGMTPADRAKVHVKPQKQKDEWDDLDEPAP
jgi:hypothetical protein